MEPKRPPYWNVPGKDLMYLVLAVQVVVLGYGAYRRWARWRGTASIASAVVPASRTMPGLNIAVRSRSRMPCTGDSPKRASGGSTATQPADEAAPTRF